MKNIEDGDIRNQIEIFEDTSDETNENCVLIHDWILIWSPFAKIENMRGSRLFSANTEEVKKIVKFIIRYSPILENKNEEKLKIKYRNKEFAISYINNIDEQNLYYEIMGEAI